MTHHHLLLHPRRAGKSSTLLEKAVREKNWYANRMAELVDVAERHLAASKYMAGFWPTVTGVPTENRLFEIMKADADVIARAKAGADV